MKIVFSFSLCLLISSSIFANIGPAGFGAFLNHYFVETGTLGGNGVAKALNSGFKEVRSIEFDFKNFNYSQQRFAGTRNVKIAHGSSATDLWNLIQDINQPITFWLDAHVCPALPNGGKNCPLLEELEQIKWHPLKNHTILIDDMHCAGTDLFDYLTKEDLINKILEINPNYHISYVDGGDDGEYQNNVMVARIN